MAYKLLESMRVENGKIYFLKERLQEIVGEYDLDSCEDHEGAETAEVISDEITDTSRWSTHHKCVFKLGERFYRTYYSEGATEMQDESPYEYGGEWIEVEEVVEKEVMVKMFVSVKEAK